MFRFLSLFRKTSEDQIDDNEYDLAETQMPGRDIVENRMPSSTGEKNKPNIPLLKPLTITKPSPEVVALQQEGEKSRITDLDRQVFDVNGKTLLGKGGENFVYAIPDNESVVGRVAIEPLIEQLAQVEGHQDTEVTTARETLQAKLAAENATYDELCAYFGNEHVPQTTRSVSEVTTSREFLEAIHKAKRRDMPNLAQAPADMLTIAAIQEKVPEINDDNSLDVQGGLAEVRNPKVMNTEQYRGAYEDATQTLVCDPESPSFDLDQFLVIHPDLRKTLVQADTNSQLKASLTDFVQKAMRYSKETGKSLDLNGAKNILFFENTDNSWSYKLIDATSPYAEAALTKTKELMEKVVAKEPIEDHIDRHLLRSAVNYQRTLNGLAKQLGIEDHLDMIPHASTVTPSEFWDILYDGGPPESSRQKQEDEETPSQQSV